MPYVDVYFLGEPLKRQNALSWYQGYLTIQNTAHAIVYACKTSRS
jgi:hypothetical protein